MKVERGREACSFPQDFDVCKQTLSAIQLEIELHIKNPKQNKNRRNSQTFI